MNVQKDMADIVALCKRRGFVFQASDIYDGINGFWDYGPLGTLLKNNLRDQWWKDMVLCPPLCPKTNEPLDIVGLDSSIIQNPKAWVASGHVDGFNDPMVDCRETKARYRADHLFVLVSDVPQEEILISFIGDDEAKASKRFEKTYKHQNYKKVSLTDITSHAYPKVWGPDASEKGTLTTPRAFNLMFKTYVGATATEDNVAYLRPETAQGIFLNYKNVLATSRVKVPFGIAQIGKAFRNEVTPRNFIYRSREFEQMEMEWFCAEEDVPLWFDYWVNVRKQWWQSVGLKADNLQLRAHTQDELAHYAKTGAGVQDIEFAFPFTAPGFGELEGIAHRSNFDLTTHAGQAKVSMDYNDVQHNRQFIPHVIEPAAGLTRGVLALLCDAYTPDESRPSKVYMKFLPHMAPVKAAILPLVNKDGLPELGQKLYMDLRQKFVVDYDPKQSIGKRYARHDEIGTPFCMTLDHQSLEDHTITVRDRDTLTQERIHMDHVKAFLDEKINSK